MYVVLQVSLKHQQHGYHVLLVSLMHSCNARVQMQVEIVCGISFTFLSALFQVQRLNLQEVGLQPAIEEQQRVLREHGSELDQEVLNSMDVLHRNITEALRINPPLIMLMRQVKKSFAVTTSTGKTYVVPKVPCASAQAVTT